MSPRFWLWARRVSQTLFFCAVTGYLAATVYPLRPAFPYDLVPKFSPLLALSATLASRSLDHIIVLPALVTVALTAVLGRAFCGWVCPVGTLIDVCDAILRRRRRETGSPRPYRWRFALLTFLLILAAFGVNWAGWGDPLALFPRSLATSVFPYVDVGFDLATRYAARIPPLGPAVAKVRQLTAGSPPLLPSGHWGVTAALAAILALGLFRKRFYCRYVCPTGALLAACGAAAPLRRRVSSEGCSACGVCTSSCRMGAIHADGVGTTASACTLCMDCLTACRRNATSFVFGRNRPRPAATPTPSPAILSRRGFLITAAASLVAAPALRWTDKYIPRDPFLLRPPGARPEDDFLARCLRCGECVRVCLTQGLAPVYGEAGLTALWTPRLVPRRGYCEYSCTMCMEVCPSAALLPLSLPAKRLHVIGIAVIDRRRCLPWSTGEDCGVCEEMCPRSPKAIEYRGRRGNKPYVIPDLCIGCGKCEYACPVEGRAAIQVYNVNAAAGTESGAPRRYRRGSASRL